MLYEKLPSQWQEAIPDSKRLLSRIDLPKLRIPEDGLIFKAFELPIESIKVVILGQDPYPTPEHAMGLAFSAPSDVKKIPPTLKNIFKELSEDVGVIPSNGNLSPLQNRGVFLLNRVLTTTPHLSQAHTNIGWEIFIEAVIKFLSQRPVVFILWGKSAQELAPLIDRSKLIIGVHPSPLSAYRGFFGSKPFSEANAKLAKLGVTAIDWKF
ncbi:MAG: uracil-DNA glycosylase [Actinomycetales bacterium]|nr:MAG: uracil-DNA glycosylase [Actinomycetales bacterium]